jgi:regulator of protease activity HflC (stomatin/prohibitin superfamily)
MSNKREPKLPPFGEDRGRGLAVGAVTWGIALLLGTAVFAIVQSLGGTNPYTPPGHEGYVYHQPIALGQREFITTQRGPVSNGWRWRQFVTNIDMRVSTHGEHMQIFSSDNLEVTFEAYARIRLRQGRVREVVERYSGEDWYANNVRRPYVTAVREEVRQHQAFTIKDQSVQIGVAILRRLRREYARTPFEFISLSIGDISYPPSVTERVVANLAAEQRRQRREVEMQIATANAEIREIRARGEAEAQQIEQATLTPLFVQHEAAELYRVMADEEAGDDGVAQSRVVMVLPTRTDRAGVPRIYQGGPQ